MQPEQIGSEQQAGICLPVEIKNELLIIKHECQPPPLLPAQCQGRVALRREVEAWYAKYSTAGRRSKSQGGTPVVSAVPVKMYGGMQEFVESDDEAEDPNERVAAFRALAAAADAADGAAGAAQQ